MSRKVKFRGRREFTRVFCKVHQSTNLDHQLVAVESLDVGSLARKRAATIFLVAGLTVISLLQLWGGGG